MEKGAQAGNPAGLTRATAGSGTAEQPVLVELPRDRERHGKGSVHVQKGPARRVLHHVTGRWGSLILNLLVSGPKRLEELQDRLTGISDKVLTRNLRDLERDGIVRREVFPSVPPRVEYSLTGPGHDCARRVDALIEWIEDNVPVFLEARGRHKDLTTPDPDGVA